ncbi:MAG: carboxypeptidase regulatory-like domain-containing protein [Planctomycetes bacterium]|nr:carboxypeptidase regulatory-like domain-containing protein [Planctomycetota bacterium]
MNRAVASLLLLLIVAAGLLFCIFAAAPASDEAVSSRISPPHSYQIRESAEAASRAASPSATPVKSEIARRGLEIVPPAGPVRPDDPIGIVIYGSVNDNEGRAINMLEFGTNIYNAVGITFRDEAKHELNAYVRARSAYSLAGVRPGRWKMTISEPWAAPFERVLEIKNEPQFQRVDIVLDRLRVLNVKFTTAEGKPFMEEYKKLNPDAEVYMEAIALATREQPPRELPRTPWRGYESSDIGRYEQYSFSRIFSKDAPNGYDGKLVLTVDPPFFVSATFRNLVLATVRVDKPVPDITIVADPKIIKDSLSSVRVRVIDDETGEPIPKARFHIGNRQGGGAGNETDENGCGKIVNIYPGLLYVEAYAKDYASTSHYCNIEPASDSTIEVRMTRPAKISGEVTDENGKPVSGYILERYPDPVQWPHPSDLGTSCTIEADGKLLLGGVARGKIILTFGQHDSGADNGEVKLFAGPVVVDTTHGSVEYVHLVARPLDGKLILDGKNCSPWPRLVTILNDEGIVISAEYFTNTRGERAIRRGKYTIQVDEDGGVHREYHAVVGSEPAEVFFCK